MTRRILKEFRIGEISAATNPAQVGALAAIRKNADPKLLFKAGPPLHDEIEEEIEPTEKDHETMSFDKAVATIRARDNCTNQEAMSKARLEHPEAFEAMQSGPSAAKQVETEQLEAIDKLAKVNPSAAATMMDVAFPGVGKSASLQKAEGDFAQKVAEIQKRDGLKRRADAMRKARQEYPDLHRAMQSA